MTLNSLKNILLMTATWIAPVMASAQQGLSDEEMRELMLLQSMDDPFGGALIAGMIGVVIVIVAAFLFMNQRERRKQDLIMRFAEKDQTIPAELLPRVATREREIRGGMVLFALGLGFGLTLYYATGDWEIAAWCLIPLFLSGAKFVNGAFFSEKAPSERQRRNGE